MSNMGMYIALTGIQADQAGMASVSNDLANVNTPDYQRQRVNLSALGTGPVGNGVEVQSIQGVSSSILDTQAMATGASAAFSSAQATVLSTAQSAFPEPSSAGIQAQLSSFWSSWDTLGNNPSNPAARQGVIEAAQLVSTSFDSASQKLLAQSQSVQSQIKTTVQNDQKLLSQVAQMNQSIPTAEATGNAAPLIDQRNQIVAQLASDLGVTTRTHQNGAMTVYLGGMSLVQDANVAKVSSNSAGQVAVYAGSGGTQLMGTVAAGGTVGGLAAGLANISNFQTQLGSVASDVANVVNSQLTAPGKAYYYTQSGTTYTAHQGTYRLFNFAGGTAGTQFSLTLNSAVVANPTLIAAAGSSTTGPNDGTNAQAMAELATTPTNTGPSGAVYAGGPQAGQLAPDGNYQIFIGALGSDVSSAQAASTAAANQAQAATAAQQAVSGVDPNAEMARMLSFQNAYQASAKVLATINNTLQSLMAAV